MRLISRSLLPILALLMLGGCASPLSREALRAADRDLQFEEVRANPQAHIGQTTVLGGRIADISVGREGTELEILRYQLGRRDRPREPVTQNGRFLARTGRILDPDLYRPGRLVSLTGRVVGLETRELRGRPVDYLVFEIGDIHRWEPPPPPRYRHPHPRPFTRFHFRYFRGW